MLHLFWVEHHAGLCCINLYILYNIAIKRPAPILSFPIRYINYKINFVSVPGDSVDAERCVSRHSILLINAPQRQNFNDDNLTLVWYVGFSLYSTSELITFSCTSALYSELTRSRN